MDEITAEVMAEWTTDDTYEVVISEEGAPAQGALRNPNFPSEVGANEDWTGTIDIENVGDSRGEFRLRIGGSTTGSFFLDPGQSTTFEMNGTGSASFTIYLLRYVP